MVMSLSARVAAVYSNVTVTSLLSSLWYTGLISPTAGGRPPPRELFPHYSPARWNIRQALALICCGDLLSSFVWTASHYVTQLNGDSGAGPTLRDPSSFTWGYCTAQCHVWGRRRKLGLKEMDPTSEGLLSKSNLADCELSWVRNSCERQQTKEMKGIHN